MNRSAGFRSKTITRQRIAAYLGGVEFARVYKRQKALTAVERAQPLPKKQDRLRVPVGVMAADLRADMGTFQRVVALSGYTIGKQKGAHPEIEPADYAMVQRIVDGGHIYRQSDTHRIGFAQDDEGQWWAAAWKRARDDREVLLVHFRRAQEYQSRTAPKKYGDALQRGMKW